MGNIIFKRDPTREVRRELASVSETHEKPRDFNFNFTILQQMQIHVSIILSYTILYLYTILYYTIIFYYLLYLYIYIKSYIYIYSHTNRVLKILS